MFFETNDKVYTGYKTVNAGLKKSIEQTILVLCFLNHIKQFDNMARLC